MSLEAAILELKASIDANTEQQKLVAAGQAKAIEVAMSVSSGKAAPAKASKPAAEPKVETAAAEPEKPAVVDYTGDEGFARMKAVISPYISTSDEDENKARGVTLKRAIAKLGAEKLSEVAEDKRATLVTWINTLSAGENVPELADEPKADSLLD